MKTCISSGGYFGSVCGGFPRDPAIFNCIAGQSSAICKVGNYCVTDVFNVTRFVQAPAVNR
ncbi:hypothetical protein OA40_10950 [Morganella morganii]|nr:hypothetical protein OA40_10950 [Morganella morganii]KNZ89607.1 hypothetical protein AKG16_02500 [Morganella morganii]